MSRDETLAAMRDELRGLLLESFSEARRASEWAQNGIVMRQQMQRGHNLFDRIVAVASGVIPAKPEATKPANGRAAPTTSGVPNGKPA